MRRAIVMSFVVVLALSFAAGASAGERYLVVYKKNVPSNAASQIAGAGGTLMRTIPEIGLGVAVSDDPGFSRAMGKNGNVHSVGLLTTRTLPDAEVAAFTDDAPTAADDLFNDGLQWGINRVHADDAWAAGYTGSHDTTVAVIDTGIAWNHPDLAPNVVYAACYTSAGFWEGPWAAGAPCNPYPSASDHGTHVAGTIAAAFDGGRAVGVAPNLALASYNTFENIPGCGNCTYDYTRWEAMVDAANRGFDVISMSLGGYGEFGGPGTNELAAHVAAEKRVANYVNKMGTTIVASAGNGGSDMNGPVIHVPGDIPQIINVSATGIQPSPFYPQEDSFDILAFYSNYGAPVTVAGPGGDCGEISGCSGAPPSGYPYQYYLILSTIAFVNPTCAETASCDPWYGWKAGTSMATPHVSAVAGLIRNVNPSLAPNQVESIIKRSAENLGDRQQFGHGMVNALAAVTK